MKNRGLYGGNDGSYNRGGKDGGNALFGDRLAENQIAEGEHVAVLARMAGERNWNQITTYCAELKLKGFAQFRIDSMISRATAGQRF